MSKHGTGRATAPSLLSTIRTHAPRLRLSWHGVRKLGISLVLAVTMLVSPSGPLAQGYGIFGAVAHAQAMSNQTKSSQGKPNLFDPRSNATSVNHFRPVQSLAVGEVKQPSAQGVDRHVNFPMKPGTLALDPDKAAKFTGSDGRLEVDVSAGAITAADLAAAGGALSLRITQIAPASGSNAGGSGIISFGMYLIQLEPVMNLL